jgi:type 1 fimbriae regulatory protein FimB
MAYLTEEELKRLMGAIKDPRDHAIFTLIVTYGLRASEVGLLRTADVDFARGRIFIRRLKNSISGEWRLLPQAERSLKRWMRERQRRGLGHSPYLFPSRLGSPISRKRLDRLMKHYGGLASLPLPKQHIHALKHTAVMQALEKTGDIIGVKDWVGHRNIQNTLRYTHLAGRHRDAFADKLLER